MFKCEIRIFDLSVDNIPALCGPLNAPQLHNLFRVALQDYNLHRSVIIKM